MSVVRIRRRLMGKGTAFLKIKLCAEQLHSCRSGGWVKGGLIIIINEAELF
jgi:hypothetical protein